MMSIYRAHGSQALAVIWIGVLQWSVPGILDFGIKATCLNVLLDGLMQLFCSHNSTAYIYKR